jgi:hypothetical protein
MRPLRPFGKCEGTYLCEEENLNRGSCTVPPWATDSIPVRHGTALELEKSVKSRSWGIVLVVVPVLQPTSMR